MKLDNFIKVENLEMKCNTRTSLLHMKLKMWYAYKHMLAADICQPENLEASPHSPINAVVTKHKDCTTTKKNYYSSSNIYVWELIIGCFRHFLQTANHTVVNTRIKFFCCVDMMFSIDLISV